MTLAEISNYGYAEGEVCGRKTRMGGLTLNVTCSGVIALHESEGCSCHISPPCSSCTSPRAYCPECDWAESEETIINDYVVQVDRKNGTYKSWEPRPLDPTRIDYRTKSHTHFSQICEGCYPPEATMADVLEKVRGTFGGRFEYFSGGKFKYIAYTD